MERQEFIDTLLINETTKNFDDLELQIERKLKIKDSFRSEAQEWSDIEEFVKNTVKWKIEKIITPFGECKLIIDKEHYTEWRRYQTEEGGMERGFILK